MAATRTESPTSASTTPQTARRVGADVGLNISIRTGSGSGRTPLSAFDAALLDAGVGDFNLVTLSSVIPPASRIRQVRGSLTGAHGDLLFCVRAEAFADQPGHAAWAGLGWLTDETGGGLFVEHHGTSEASVVEQIELSLADMNRSRGGRYGAMQVTLASAECVEEPVCALVVAAYRVTSWHDGTEPASADPPPESGLVSTPPGASPAPASGPGGTHTQLAEDWIAEDHPLIENGSRDGEPARVGSSAQPSSDEAEQPGVVTRLSVEKEVDYATAKRFYKLYVATFGALDTEAAGRQLLTQAEFLEEMLDPRVHKYVAWDQDDRAVGMSTLATDVATMPWVSPTYFAHRYPEQSARGAVFYLGFTLVRPEHRGLGVFQLMIENVIRYVIEQRGVVAWDTCQANDERGMNATAFRALEALGEVTTEVIDRQTYYAAIMHGPRKTATPHD